MTSAAISSAIANISPYVFIPALCRNLAEFLDDIDNV